MEEEAPEVIFINLEEVLVNEKYQWYNVPIKEGKEYKYIREDLINDYVQRPEDQAVS